MGPNEISVIERCLYYRGSTELALLLVTLE